MEGEMEKREGYRVGRERKHGKEMGERWEERGI